jgi:hypothetical protein
MKKLVVALMLLLGTGVSFSQKQSVKVNPLAFFGGSDLVSYERAINNNMSGLIGAGLSSFSIGSYKYSSFGLEVQSRYYFKEAIKGFYGGGQVGFNSGTVELNSPYLTSSDLTFTSFRIGGKAGYQWIWDSGLTVDLNVGYGINTFSYSSSDAVLGLSASGALPNLGFGIGYSF